MCNYDRFNQVLYEKGLGGIKVNYYLTLIEETRMISVLISDSVRRMSITEMSVAFLT